MWKGKLRQFNGVTEVWIYIWLNDKYAPQRVARGACHKPPLALSLFLCLNFRMKPRIWLSLGVNRSRPRIALVTTVIFHEFYFIIFISIIILNYVIVVISLNFLYLIRNSKFIVWKMENDAKSLIVELAPLYVQSVWGV